VRVARNLGPPGGGWSGVATTEVDHPPEHTNMCSRHQGGRYRRAGEGESDSLSPNRTTGYPLPGRRSRRLGPRRPARWSRSTADAHQKPADESADGLERFGWRQIGALPRDAQDDESAEDASQQHIVKE
jgi:hypothetical protein